MRIFTLWGILVTLFAFIGNVNAEVITINGANEIANNFFARTLNSNKLIKNIDSQLEYAWDSNSLYNQSSSLLKEEEVEPTFYVFSNEKAFVIVSAEDNLQEVIGYSFEGSINSSDEIPAPMKEYLKGIDKEIKYFRENISNSTKSLKATATETGGTIVKQLETANWGQGSPFNNLCPTSGTSHCLTGCVPTAYAIVMRYHEWPISGTGKVYNPNTAEPTDISQRVYEWGNMPLNYISGQYTDAQATEVAEIMVDLGYRFMASYGTSSTDVSAGLGSTEYLQKSFGYNNVPSTSRDMVGDTEWKRLLKESLNNNCPVPYRATSAINPDQIDGKHMFVVDGYTSNDYFHFNWGWSGSQNGYFTISAITPDASRNYITSNYAYFNFMPNKEEFEVNASVSPSAAGKVSINGGTIGTSVTASLFENSTVTLTATANSGYTFNNWTCNGSIVSTEKSFNTKVTSNTTDNTYIANFLVVGTTNISIPITYNSNYGSVSYNGSAIQGTTITAKENQEVTLTATPKDGYIFNGWSVTSNGSTKNIDTKDFTFIATSGIEITAEFSLAVADYVVSHETGTKTNASGARSSTWTYTTNTNNPVALQLTSTSGTTEVYGLSNSYDRYYAYAYDSNTNGYDNVTYTLSVPAGYVITGYNMTYWVSSSHKGQVTVSNGTTTNTPTNTNDQNLSASGLNTQSTSFTLSVSQTGQQYITVESFTVTIKKDGSEGPVTPPTPAKYSVSVTASAGGSATSSATEVEEGGNVTLTATPFEGYEFAGWSIETSVISYDNPYTVTISANTEFIANFNELSSGGGLPGEVGYCTPSGNHYTDNYLTAITSSGAEENISYSATSHPGSAYFVVPDTIKVCKGNSFTLNLVAKSLGAGSSYSVREDIRYCHASLFTDFDIDGEFGSAVTTWGNNPPAHNVYGNYDECMNITTEISVPDNALLGASRIRVIYTNAWSSFPDACTTSLDKGIAYDIVVDVTDLSGIENSDSRSAKIYASDGVININNYLGNVKIVNIAGEVVKDIFCDTDAQIKVNKGIYLVVTSEGVVKVII